jgi:hypothetical protein
MRVVYLGACVLQSGKAGQLWALEDDAAAAPDAESLRLVASPFGSEKKTRVVGAVYETVAKVTDGRLTELSRDMIYRSMLETDAIVYMALRDKGVNDVLDAAKAEAKAARSGVVDGPLDQVARIVAMAPLGDREHVIRGFSSEVRRRANLISRQG